MGRKVNQEASMSEYAKEIKADEFQDVINATTPTMVDFWAPWCGPCKMVAPMLDEIGKEYDGKLNVVKLNVDEASGIAGTYGIRGVPTMMLFKDGKVVDTVVGLLPKENMQAWIDQKLGI